MTSRPSLRIGMPSVIDPAQVQMRYPADKLAYVGAAPGPGSPHAVPAVAPLGPSDMRVVLLNHSGSGAWDPKEYEIGQLTFAVNHSLQPSIIDLKIVACEVRRVGKLAPFKTIDEVLFVE